MATRKSKAQRHKNKKRSKQTQLCRRHSQPTKKHRYYHKQVCIRSCTECSKQKKLLTPPTFYGEPVAPRHRQREPSEAPKEAQSTEPVVAQRKSKTTRGKRSEHKTAERSERMRLKQKLGRQATRQARATEAKSLKSAVGQAYRLFSYQQAQETPTPTNKPMTGKTINKQAHSTRNASFRSRHGNVSRTPTPEKQQTNDTQTESGSNSSSDADKREESDSSEDSNSEANTNNTDNSMRSLLREFKIPYNTQLNIATLNCRGLNVQSKREQIMQLMRRLGIDVLCLQETHVNANSEEQHDEYTFIFATSVTTQNGQTNNNAAKGKGKGNKGKNQARAPNQEYHGVGFALNKAVRTATLDFVQHSGRLATITLQTQGTPIHIITAYAPQAGRPKQEKEQFYSQLNQLCDEIPAAHVKLIYGDFNARLQHRLEEENEIIGGHLFGLGREALERQCDDTNQNRQLFVQFCLERDMIISNTFFQKPNQAYSTYKNTTTEGFKAPWTPERFHMIDVCLVDKRWRNAVKNVEARPDVSVDSDHAVVTTRVKVRLAAKTKNPTQRPIRYRNPTEQQKQDYNSCVRDKMHAMDDSTSLEQKFNALIHSMKHAADTQLTQISRLQKQHYLTQATWQLIEERQACRDRGDTINEQIVNRKIKKEAKKDKRAHRIKEMEEGIRLKEKWNGIKKERKIFTPNHTKQQDIRGNRIPLGQRAKATAEYLREIQWKLDPPPPSKHNPPKVIIARPEINTEDIAMAELAETLSKLKNNKSPGPDNLTTELFKWLDDGNQKTLCDLYNLCWQAKRIPDTFKQAEITCLYKKGSTENLGNYRPIALLNTTYKIFVSMIQKRLAAGLDNQIQTTQYGFRQKRSTSQALYVARRIQDLAEQSGDEVLLVFLDWEKAFDKINQSRMLEALGRLNIPSPMMHMIGAIYDNPLFRVRHKEQVTDYERQSTGIRQGCPLSPYLFILVMSVMFSDIHRARGRDINKGRINGITFTEILYADDTLLVSKNTTAARKMLAAIEEESKYYNMKLNHDKCLTIAMNGIRTPTFTDGTKLKTVDHAKYLGGQITVNVNPRTELNSRISDATVAVKSLELFWKHVRCDMRWKMQVYNAVVISKLTYGLETLQFTKNQGGVLDSFQMKGLRKIMNIKPTFIDRSITNEEVLRLANEHCQTTALHQQGPKNKIKPVTEIIQQRRVTLLGHIIRSNPQDPMHQVTFANDEIETHAPWRRRVGRPRLKWIEETMKEAWSQIASNFEPYSSTLQQRTKIKEAAIQRRHPFGAN